MRRVESDGGSRLLGAGCWEPLLGACTLVRNSGLVCTDSVAWPRLGKHRPSRQNQRSSANSVSWEELLKLDDYPLPARQMLVAACWQDGLARLKCLRDCFWSQESLHHSVSTNGAPAPLRRKENQLAKPSLTATQVAPTSGKVRALAKTILNSPSQAWQVRLLGIAQDALLHGKSKLEAIQSSLEAPPCASRNNAVVLEVTNSCLGAGIVATCRSRACGEGALSIHAGDKHLLT